VPAGGISHNKFLENLNRIVAPDYTVCCSVGIKPRLAKLYYEISSCQAAGHPASPITSRNSSPSVKKFPTHELLEQRAS
jgi:hypothetical protein